MGLSQGVRVKEWLGRKLRGVFSNEQKNSAKGVVQISGGRDVVLIICPSESDADFAVRKLTAHLRPATRQRRVRAAKQVE